MWTVGNVSPTSGGLHDCRAFATFFPPPYRHLMDGDAACERCGAEASPLKCSKCREAHYCVSPSEPCPQSYAPLIGLCVQNQACQLMDWDRHKTRCIAKGMWMNAESGLMSMTLTDISRSLWEEGEVSPISAMVGFPIRLIPKVQQPAEQPILERARMSHRIEGAEDETVVVEARGQVYMSEDALTGPTGRNSPSPPIS